MIEKLTGKDFSRRNLLVKSSMGLVKRHRFVNGFDREELLEDE